MKHSMNLKMTFIGVERTKEEERDPEIPRTEDSGLSSISFLPAIFEDSYKDCFGFSGGRLTLLKCLIRFGAAIPPYGTRLTERKAG